MLLLTVLLYVIVPNDFLPDYFPYGYVDDLLVCIFLTTIARAIIPGIVLSDARKAIACGIVFLGVTWSAPGGHLIELPVLPAETRITRSLPIAQLQRGKGNLPGQIQMTCGPPGLQANKNEGLRLLSSALDKAASIRCRQKTAHRMVFSPSTITLVYRGGQHQLYASADASSFIAAAPIHHSLSMPPCIMGGIFCFSSLETEKEEKCRPVS